MLPSGLPPDLGRLSGLSGLQVASVAERTGWQLSRARGGSHLVYRKRGQSSNLAIPNHRELRPGTVHKLITTMGLTVEEFLALVRR